MLANTSTPEKKESQLMDIQNKYDYHSNGRTLNMYQHIRNQQLDRMGEL